MIKTVNDLQKLLLKEADIFPEMLMNDNGCTDDRVELLRNTLPELPDSYIKWLPRVNLNGICIGYFITSPFSANRIDTVESVLEAHNDLFFPKEFMEKHRLYQVGAYNTDLICISAGTDKFKEGEVLFVEEGYDIYNPEESQVHKLAKDFEQFLIIVGNFSEVRREINEDDSNWEEKRDEFIARLKFLGVSEEYYEIWLSLF